MKITNLFKIPYNKSYFSLQVELLLPEPLPLDPASFSQARKIPLLLRRWGNFDHHFHEFIKLSVYGVCRDVAVVAIGAAGSRRFCGRSGRTRCTWPCLCPTPRTFPSNVKPRVTSLSPPLESMASPSTALSNCMAILPLRYSHFPIW